MALAPETNADIPRVAIVQTLRIAILIAVLPLAALWLSEPVPPAVFVPLSGLEDAILLFVGGVGGAILAYLVRLPAGLLVGGLFVSAVLHGSGLVDGRPPEWVAIAGFVSLGTLIGTRFAGTRWKELVQVLGVSLVSFVISFVDCGGDGAGRRCIDRLLGPEADRRLCTWRVGSDGGACLRDGPRSGLCSGPPSGPLSIDCACRALRCPLVRSVGTKIQRGLAYLRA
jgi:hypothetical protein